MERFVKGDVVVLPFPFSNLKEIKKRPALISAEIDGEDLILCQISSQSRKDKDSIKLKTNDFEKGILKIDSFIRPTKLFTVHKSIILYKVGHIKKAKIKEFEKKICEIFTR